MAGDSDTTAEFTRALASLKRHGSNILLVGGPNRDAHLGACTRLLGEDTATRQRCVAITDGERNVAERLPGGAEGPTVIDYASPTRSTATEQAPTEVGDVVEARTLDGLATAIADEIDEAVARADLEPAEFRLCVDSLRPLVEEYTEREVFRVLHGLTRDVRRVDGMGHYHLPVPFDDATVRRLEPLFEATVEVRTAPDLQQRWHLTEQEITTDWLPL